MKKNKLSPTQEKLLQDLKDQVTKARSYTKFEDYFQEVLAPRYNSLFNTPEKYHNQDPKGYEEKVKYWEDLKQGKALCHCSGPTIYKLEKLGYITIIKDTTNTTSSIDLVQLINF